DYGDYIEQITYLLFLKMADERGIAIPKDCDWPTLRDYTGTELTDHYIDILRKLGKAPGLLGDIYAGAQSRFKHPINLKRLIGLMDETEWTALDVDVKAAAYEGLLEKAASEGKKGAGQYFTPRVLIQSIVRCMKPDPRVRREFTICDPACGTGGFLVAAYEWLKGETKGGALDRDASKRIRTATYFGQDLVDRPRRMALMNLYLHNIEPQIKLGDAIYEPPAAQRFDVVLTNPPFGTKGAKTEQTCIYDPRTNVPGNTKKHRPLTPAHFAEFDKCYGADTNGQRRAGGRKPPVSAEDRWRSFSIADVKARDFKLDSF